MKLIFMGTPEFALPTLDSIHRNHDLKAIITQPDKPKGRRLHLSVSAVKEFALKNNIRLIQPKTIKNNIELQKIVEEIRPDVIVVAAYGRILPMWLLRLPTYGCLNLHASLLPEYRGAAPIQRAIMDGRKKTGVSTMKMAPDLDAGDVYLQSAVDITKTDNCETLTKKLAIAGAVLVLDTLKGISEQNISATPQDDEKATYASKVSKAEMRIDWENDATNISYLIRALSPRPGAYTLINNKMIKILKAELRPNDTHPPKTIISLKNEFIIAAKDGALSLQIVKPEGKAEMSGADYGRGSRLTIGEMI